jgi:hypothetical protein
VAGWLAGWLVFHAWPGLAGGLVLHDGCRRQERELVAAAHDGPGPGQAEQGM